MKAALNGALNCSILDGWWDECYDGSNGWAINSADDDPDLGRRDAREATSLFGLLERELVPLFYDRPEGLPVGWIDTIKHNWRSLGPFVTAARMVRNYTTELYEPAAASSTRALADDASVARDLAAWKLRVRAAWPVVKVFDIESDTTPAHEGDQRHVRAHVEIDGLDASSVTVQALHGPIDSAGEFIGAPLVVTLALSDAGVWEADYSVGEAGPYGLTVRALPSHPHLISPVEMGTVAWAI
jgi:starch phosphorylase